ncbi:MAG: hypothetical protein IIW10_07410 [Spirochaetaceae bacterium]|nr:hypothetical protein [Spirochaetaceae bacterium]
MNNTKKKYVFWICLTLLLCAVYIFFAARPFSQELTMEIQWTVDLNRSEDFVAGSEKSDDAIPFRLGNRLGYFSESGKLLLCEDFPFKATICSTYWATFDASSHGVTVKDVSGNEVTKIDCEGFPFFNNQRCFVFLPGGNSLCEYNTSGERKWMYENFSPITAFQATPNDALIGTADGNLICLDSKGEKTASFYPGGSDFSIILGADISSNGKFVAAISGIDKQRIILAQVKDSQPKILYHRYLAGNIRQNALVRFASSDKMLYFATPNGLGVLDVASHRTSEIPLAGKIVDVIEIPGTELWAVLLNQINGYEVALIEDFSNMVGSFAVEAKNVFIASRSSTLYVGHDDKISAFALKRGL